MAINTKVGLRFRLQLLESYKSLITHTALSTAMCNAAYYFRENSKRNNTV